jgi:hypothetical protein
VINLKNAFGSADGQAYGHLSSASRRGDKTLLMQKRCRHHAFAAHMPVRLFNELHFSR